jgi:HPt (histidine-containing phosphotransfer) domain-containing protein
MLLPRFIEHRKRDAVEIRDGLARGAFEDIARIGHNMRGNGLSYGVAEIGALGARLESAAHAKDAAEIGAALVELEECIAGLSAGPAGEST